MITKERSTKYCREKKSWFVCIIPISEKLSVDDVGYRAKLLTVDSLLLQLQQQQMASSVNQYTEDAAAAFVELQKLGPRDTFVRHTHIHQLC